MPIIPNIRFQHRIFRLFIFFSKKSIQILPIIKHIRFLKQIFGRIFRLLNFFFTKKQHDNYSEFSVSTPNFPIIRFLSEKSIPILPFIKNIRFLKLILGRIFRLLNFFSLRNKMTIIPNIRYLQRIFRLFIVFSKKCIPILPIIKNIRFLKRIFGRIFR